MTDELKNKINSLVKEEDRISIKQLKNIIMKYDHDHGEYPESHYEGLNVYEFICGELGIKSDFSRDLFDVDYFNLLKKTFKKGK